MLDRYFDHAATSPVRPEVLEAMLPFLKEECGNAHSLHSFGRRAEAAVERARAQVADLLGAEDPSQIYFTSGATEANQWVLRAHPEARVSPFEHNSIQALGHPTIPNQGSALIPRDDLSFISVMAVNNETGTQWDARHIPARYRHVDATQAVGKIPFTVEGLDYASCSAHKFNGPKGIGALFCREFPPAPILLGEQEHGNRGGTLNVPGIVGMGEAARLARDELQQRLSHSILLRQALLQELDDQAVVISEPGASPHIVAISFPGVQGEALVIEMDLQGFAISSGAACSSRNTEPSHVLKALNLSDDLVRGAIRISFGLSNTIESTGLLARSLILIAKKLRTMNTQ